jgi:hypothetical protein
MKYSFNKNELFIYYIYIQNMSYSYIHKKGFIHTKKLFIQKKELFIYKKKFLVIIIYKKVSCTKMLYILQKMSYSYKKNIHTKKGSYSYKK